MKRHIPKHVAALAAAILIQHAEGADTDAGFDGGEWSGPWHEEAVTREIASLAANNGLDEDMLWQIAIESLDEGGAA